MAALPVRSCSPPPWCSLYFSRSGSAAPRFFSAAVTPRSPARYCPPAPLRPRCRSQLVLSLPRHCVRPASVLWLSFFAPAPIGRAPLLPPIPSFSRFRRLSRLGGLGLLGPSGCRASCGARFLLSTSRRRCSGARGCFSWLARSRLLAPWLWPPLLFLRRLFARSFPCSPLPAGSVRAAGLAISAPCVSSPRPPLCIARLARWFLSGCRGRRPRFALPPPLLLTRPGVSRPAVGFCHPRPGTPPLRRSSTASRPPWPVAGRARPLTLLVPRHARSRSRLHPFARRFWLCAGQCESRRAAPAFPPRAVVPGSLAAALRGHRACLSPFSRCPWRSCLHLVLRVPSVGVFPCPSSLAGAPPRCCLLFCGNAPAAVRRLLAGLRLSCCCLRGLCTALLCASGRPLPALAPCLPTPSAAFSLSL